jgi:hypothetical protein
VMWRDWSISALGRKIWSIPTVQQEDRCDVIYGRSWSRWLKSFAICGLCKVDAAAGRHRSGPGSNGSSDSRSGSSLAVSCSLCDFFCVVTLFTAVAGAGDWKIKYSFAIRGLCKVDAAAGRHRSGPGSNGSSDSQSGSSLAVSCSLCDFFCVVTLFAAAAGAGEWKFKYCFAICWLFKVGAKQLDGFGMQCARGDSKIK